jgi:hypothetical protein
MSGELRSEKRVMIVPTNATQKAHMFLSWNLANALKL